jgi:hypothetical protein
VNKNLLFLMNNVMKLQRKLNEDDQKELYHTQLVITELLDAIKEILPQNDRDTLTKRKNSVLVAL